MGRKIKKYDVITLREKRSDCWMGDFLVLSVKLEGIKLFALRPRNVLDYNLKEFAKKYEVRFYG